MIAKARETETGDVGDVTRTRIGIVIEDIERGLKIPRSPETKGGESTMMIAAHDAEEVEVHHLIARISLWLDYTTLL